MIPPPFDYARPDTLSDAIRLLAEHGEDARPLAGGQSLIPMLRLRLLAPKLLVDLGNLPELGNIRATGDAVAVGALVTHRQVATAPELGSLPLFADAGADIGDVHVRNRGTLAGSLAHADPAGDWPAVALAADASVEVAGPSGSRSVPIDGFFAYVYTPALRPGELITGVRLPVDSVPGYGSAYTKFAHGASGYALAGVAAVVTMNDDTTVASTRLAATGVAATPLRLHAAEATLTGRSLNPDRITDAANAAPVGVEAISDGWASSDYRLHLLTVACRRTLERVAGRVSRS